MKTNTFLTGCLLAAAGVGCGGVSGIPIEKTATDFAAAICPKAYDCCTADQLMGNKDLAGTTEAECETKTAQSFRNQLQAMQDAENAGRAKYDQAKVDACLAALRAADCSTLKTIYSVRASPGATDVRDAPGRGRRHLQERLRVRGRHLPEPVRSRSGHLRRGARLGATCGSDRCGTELYAIRRRHIDTTASASSSRRTAGPASTA